MPKILPHLKQLSKDDPDNRQTEQPQTPPPRKEGWFFSMCFPRKKKRKHTLVQVTGDGISPSPLTAATREQIRVDRTPLSHQPPPHPHRIGEEVEEEVEAEPQPRSAFEIPESRPYKQNSSAPPSSPSTIHSRGAPPIPPLPSSMTPPPAVSTQTVKSSKPKYFTGRVETSRTSLDYFSGQPWNPYRRPLSDDDEHEEGLQGKGKGKGKGILDPGDGQISDGRGHGGA